MPRFAANLALLFAERPMLERFGAAADAGFRAVELQAPYDMPPDSVRAELERHRLTMLGINTGDSGPGEAGLAAVPGREPDFALLLDQALDYATRIGARSVHCLSGYVPPDQRAAAERTMIANLSRAAEAADRLDLTLLIEPLNPRDRPNYFLQTVEAATALISQIGAPNVRIQFDFYHAQICGGDLMTRFERHFPDIGHVQVAAVPTRHEPDEGEVNYAAIFALLDRLGYDGWVGCEYAPRGRTEDGLGWARPYGLVPRVSG